MKTGVMLINTSRGALLDTVAVIEALKSGKIGYLGLDVYEEEEQIFFEDRSGLIIPDDVFARLLTFPNVIITGHQAFFTREALENIAATTIKNVTDFEEGRRSGNEVTDPATVPARLSQPRK
jgi:D-lactate dehydrogenase